MRYVQIGNGNKYIVQNVILLLIIVMQIYNVFKIMVVNYQDIHTLKVYNGHNQVLVIQEVVIVV